MRPGTDTEPTTNMNITRLVLCSVTVVFVEYGHCATVLNPVHCSRISYTNSDCFVPYLSDSNSSVISMQAMIPNTTRDLNIRCTTANDNTIPKTAFVKHQVQNLTFWNCFFSQFPSNGLQKLTSLRALEFRWTYFIVKNCKEAGPQINFETTNETEPFICTLTNLTHFAITKGKIKTMDRVLHCSLAPRCCNNLQTLDFKVNLIRSVNPGDFNGLSNLKILDLSFNKLSSLPKDEIAKLKSLTKLLLIGNSLGTLSTAVFQHNPFLTQISISVAQMLMPFYYPIDQSSCEQDLHLHYEGEELAKRLTSSSICVETNNSLDNRLLSNLNNINKLTLEFPFKFDELTQTLPPFLKLTLKTLVELMELSLVYKGPLYPKMFANFHLLKTLNLIISVQIFNTSQLGLFDGLLELQVLKVEPVFYRYLDLHENTSLQAGVLRGLPKLKALHMNGMRVKSVSTKALEGLNSLSVISLNFNFLEYVPYCICNRKKASSLTEVYLEGNEIRTLRKSDIQGCQNLTLIDLSRNKLTSLCEKSLTEFQSMNGNTFGSLQKLSDLLLSHNEISAFDFSTIPQSLNRLDLSNNHISSLTDQNNIRHKLQLKTLNLVSNNLFIFSLNSFPPSVITLSLGNYELKLFDKLIPPVKIDTNTFTNLSKLRSATIFYYYPLKIDRNAFSNSNTTRHMSTSFNIIFDPMDTCPTYPSKARYKINVVSYYNSLKSQHHYCQYKRECSGELRYGRCMELMVNVLDCGNVGFQEFPHSFPSELAIEHLFLDGNNFNTIPSTAFATLNNSVRVLYLNNSHISKIADNAFLYNVWVDELHLENNDLRDVVFLKYLRNKLQYLYLQNNRLISLAPTDLKQSHKLLFSHNVHGVFLNDSLGYHRDYNITQLFNNKEDFHHKSVFDLFITLKSLVLRNNSIQCTGQFGIGAKGALTLIDFSYNKIKYIEPDDFGNLTLVQLLDLQENLISNLNGKEFVKMKNLRILLLNNNFISYVAPKTFVNQKSLEKLYLNHNLLSELCGEEFVGLGNLRLLSLSNNNLSQMNKNTFSELQQLQELDLSANKIATLGQNVFSELKQLMRLYLSNNYIKITYDEFKPLIQLQELRLNRNSLSDLQITSFENLKNLAVLNLDNNKLQMPQLWNLPISIQRVHIENNSLKCDCAFMRDFGDYLSNAGHQKVVNAEVITCMSIDNQEPIDVLKFDYSSICKTSYELLLGICAAFIFVLFIVVSALYYWRLEVQVLVYSRYGKRLFSRYEEETDKVYDVFISYSSEDEAFVIDDLLPELMNYRICIHFKDFLPGAYINDNIIDAVEKSSRTLLVFSPRFIQSPFCNFEFRIAHQKSLDDHRCRLILLLLEDVDENNMEREQKAYLRTNTYLRWDDRLFWEKLRFALPNVKPDAPPPEVLLLQELE